MVPFGRSGMSSLSKFTQFQCFLVPVGHSGMSSLSKCEKCTLRERVFILQTLVLLVSLSLSSLLSSLLSLVRGADEADRLEELEGARVAEQVLVQGRTTPNLPTKMIPAKTP